MNLYDQMQTRCGPYDREHDWTEFSEREERGVLVMTHGNRAGRIYTVEQTWRERDCKRCGMKHKDPVSRSAEWPGGGF